MVSRLPQLPVGLIVAGLGAASTLGSVGYLAYNGIYSVKPGEKAIIFSRIWGVKEKVYSEGTHILVPWFEWPIIMDVRTRPRAIKSVTGTRDLQMVDLGLRVLTRPDQSALPTIYRRLGLDYDDKVLPSIVNEVVKQVVAQFNATALLTQRELVSRSIKQQLQERAKEFHIVLEDVSITDLKFGKEFEKAVESKQVAQQDAERARFIVEKALQDKQSTIIRAQGEARSVELIGRSANPGFIQLRRIDAARSIAQSIAGSQNTVYLPSESLLLSMANSLYGPNGAPDSTAESGSDGSGVGEGEAAAPAAGGASAAPSKGWLW